jgi:ATP adenylyltransferase
MSNSSSLQAPWRIDYIRSIDKTEGCFLCQAAAAATEAERRERLVLWDSEHSLVLLNRYPYVNGHLMVAPKAHKPEFANLTEAERRERLVLWDSEHSLVLLNRYPYVNGHLMVAPKAHKPEFADLTEAELLDLQVQTREAIELLKRAMGPQGFNVGINLGRCAGAGVPGHLHQHVVPRWNGDTNFMSVVGEVRVVPQAMSQLYNELARVRAEVAGRK